MNSLQETTVVRHAERGWSLLELMVTIAVMSAVFSVAFLATYMFEQRGAAETQKIDSVQTARDFMDQVNRDIHDTGYPPLQVGLNGSNTCVGNVNVACGIVYFSPLKVQYEGDLDGTGTVYVVTLQVQPGANGKCPCILQRGVVTKTQFLANVVPTYYTEVNGLLNSGQWNGTAAYTVSLSGSGNYAQYATNDVFDGYFNDSTQVTAICNSEFNCVNSLTPIREIQVTANVATTYADMQQKNYPVFSITTKARLSNISP